MQRIEWVDRALRDWAVWRLTSTGGYRSPAFDRDPGEGGLLSQVEITAEQEAGALRIDAAVAQLPKDLRATVVAHYTWEGGMDQITRLLRVTRATVHRRLCQSDIRISEWLAATATGQASKRNNFVTYT